MKFISTRGQAPSLGFCDTVLAGLASDGGLYLPETWPQVSAEEIARFAGQDFTAIAFAIINRFIDGEIPEATITGMITDAYASFDHPSVTPLRELEPGHFILELSHGPTLAFKDVAMQFLARVMDHILTTRQSRATIVGATSGDTGSAAIEAFRGRDNIDIFILHPHNRTSEVQRRQMTTVTDDNVFNIALSGTFDDCQNIVKGMFANHRFRTDTRLSGVNSINWGRIVAQIVYYFKAAADLGAPHRQLDFTVPTGNFGDIFAGYAAKCMGLPIRKLIIATNENDILARTLNEGRCEKGVVTPTASPSMDIQISSNFERLLFEAAGRDGARVRQLMDSFAQSGGFEVPADMLAAIRKDFAADKTSEAETGETIKDCLKRSDYLVDPHTAVAIAVARRQLDRTCPMITLSTADPAKFPATVKAATGTEPRLPAWLADLHDRPETMEILANDQRVVEEFILQNARISEELSVS